MNAVVLDTTEAAPNLTVSELLSHSGPVLVDFDETIYLRHSIEDFIDTARPALLALLVIRLLDAIRPWQWTGGDATRDVWRVRVIMLLFPWTKLLWARRAPALAAVSANGPLVEAMKARSQKSQGQLLAIMTTSFDVIVMPLIAALGLEGTRVIAPKITSLLDRREGKLRFVASKIGNEAVRHALVLSGAKHIDPLLETCAIPVRGEWTQPQFRPALSRHYLPGQYIAFVAHAGERYITRNILREDFLLWVLASVGLAAQPVAHIAALFCLLVSFWAIYETGYVDRDRFSRRQETQQAQVDSTLDDIVPTPTYAPWIWALIFGGAGVLLLDGVTGEAAFDFAAWSVVLIATYGAFALCNRFDPATRVWWYGCLQVARAAAFIALVPIHLIGAVAVGAHALARWSRIPDPAAEKQPRTSYALSRLFYFVLLAVLLSTAIGGSTLWSLSALALLAWNVVLARRDLFVAFADARRIDRLRPEEKRAASQSRSTS